GRLLVLLVLHAVVLPVQEAFGVGADELAAVADVIKPVALHRGAGTDALLGPVVDAPRGQLVVDRLPEELAVRLAETHDDALVQPLLPGLIDVAGIARLLVVGAAEYLAAGDDGSAVGLGAQVHAPLDVLLAAGLDAPFGWDVPFERIDEVTTNAAAEHGP